MPPSGRLALATTWAWGVLNTDPRGDGGFGHCVLRLLLQLPLSISVRLGFLRGFLSLQLVLLLKVAVGFIELLKCLGHLSSSWSRELES